MWAFCGLMTQHVPAMQDSDAIRNAVLRYEVSHPVINDRNMTLWRDLGVASWPTLMVVSPRGRVIATLAGDLRCSVLQNLSGCRQRSQGCMATKP